MTTKTATKSIASQIKEAHKTLDYFEAAEAIAKILEQDEIIECGYDVSEAPIHELEKLFNHFYISTGSALRDEKRLCYVFRPYKINTIEIRMGAHPFANGLLFETTQGTRGEGFCSYIGIKGPKTFVNAFKKMMKNFGDCKDYSNTPDFI